MGYAIIAEQGRMIGGIQIRKTPGEAEGMQLLTEIAVQYSQGQLSREMLKPKIKALAEERWGIILKPERKKVRKTAAIAAAATEQPAAGAAGAPAAGAADPPAIRISR